MLLWHVHVVQDALLREYLDARAHLVATSASSVLLEHWLGCRKQSNRVCPILSYVCRGILRF